MYYIYRYVCGQNLNRTLAINSHSRLDFSSIYRPALSLHSSKTLSSSSKSYIICTLLYLSGWMTQLPAQTYRLVLPFSKLELALEVRTLPSCHCLQTRQLAELLQTGKECEYEELRFRRGSPLACGVMGIACSSCQHYLLSYCIFPQAVSFWR